MIAITTSISIKVNPYFLQGGVAALFFRDFTGRWRERSLKAETEKQKVTFGNPTGQPRKWQPNTRLEFRTLPLVPHPKITDIKSSNEELFALRYEVVRKP